MLKIINYTELCSNAFLNSIDELSLDNGGEHLWVDIYKKKIQEVFKFYLTSQLRNKKQFGYHNVVIKSCNTNNNWRHQKEFGDRYVVNDSSIKIEPQKLELFLEKCWIDLKRKHKDFIFIYKEDVDTFDLVPCIERIVGTNVINDDPRFYILKDGNDIFCHQEGVPSYILQEIEEELRTNKLVL